MTMKLEGVERHWTCNVCDREWGMFAFECANCGYRRGSMEYLGCEPGYVAPAGTGVMVNEGGTSEYRSVIVAHCLIKSVLHYITWCSVTPGHSYRITSTGALTEL